LEYLLVIILVSYVIVAAAEQFLLQLNLKNLVKHGTEVPPGFTGHVDTETLRKMRDYTVAHGRLDRIESGVSMVITLIFLFGGLLNWLNNSLAALHWPPVLTGVVFFMILVYADTVINIPFSLYNTFSLEKRFGFSNQTFGLWLKDLLKSLVINTLLLGFLFSVILWLILTLPEMWWLAGWIFVLLFSIFLLYISPYVIEPLFNKFSPIENETLEERIKEIMSKIGLKINRIFKMDASKRSSHSNAYFTGIGHVKRIVLFDTLLANHDEDEIIAILAHEAGHWKKKHVMKMLIAGQVFALLAFYAAFRLTAGNFLTELFLLDSASLHSKLLLCAFIGSLVLFPLKPVMTYLSRKHEIEADNFAVRLTQSPGPLAQALIKLGKDNLANLHPHPWYAAIYYSHPPLAQRVKRLLGFKSNGALSGKP